MPTAIAQNLLDLGLREGDTVLVRAAAKAVVRAPGSPATALIDALLEVVGEQGTIAALAFTDDYYKWHKGRAAQKPFRADLRTNTGGFAQAMLDRPNAHRSTHPSNSFVAIGANAGALLAEHDHTATSFHPMKALIRLGGKMILVGCVQSSPGFSTVHLAQESLGLATRTLMKGMRGAYFEAEDGSLRWFSRNDVSGCSAGFSKLYKNYVERGLLSTGWVGGAYSILVSAEKAYELEHAMLKANPSSALCDDPYCSSCGLRTYLPYRMAGFILRLPIKLARRKYRKAA